MIFNKNDFQNKKPILENHLQIPKTLSPFKILNLISQNQIFNNQIKWPNQNQFR